MVDIAEDMEHIDAETLDDPAYSLDEGVGLAGGDDGLHDTVVIELLIVAGGGFVEELFDDIGELLRERLAHLGAGVFGGDFLEHLHQAM